MVLGSWYASKTKNQGLFFCPDAGGGIFEGLLVPAAGYIMFIPEGIIVDRVLLKDQKRLGSLSEKIAVMRDEKERPGIGLER